MDPDKNIANTGDAENETRTKINCSDNKVKWRINLSVGYRPLNMVLDTGSQLTLIPVGLLKPDTMIKVTKRISIIGISGVENKFETIGLAKGFIVVDGKSMSIDFQVVHDKFTNGDGILGMDFFKSYGALIDIADEKIIFQHSVMKMNEAEQPDILDNSFEEELCQEKRSPQRIEFNQENCHTRRNKMDQHFLKKIVFKKGSLNRQDSLQSKPNQEDGHGDNEAPIVILKKKKPHKEHESSRKRKAQGRNEIDHLSRNYLEESRDVYQSKKKSVEKESRKLEVKQNDQKPAWAYERTNLGFTEKENQLFKRESVMVRRSKYLRELLLISKKEQCTGGIERIASENFRVP